MDLRDQLQQALGAAYRFERELGQGGMATVFLAQDLKHDRNVAVKGLRPELAELPPTGPMASRSSLEPAARLGSCR
jgi:serine/threonine protein kinase